jgi:hypothetical protein
MMFPITSLFIAQSTWRQYGTEDIVKISWHSKLNPSIGDHIKLMQKTKPGTGPSNPPTSLEYEAI